MRLIIDTDIGTDVDDLWTLAMLPGLANVSLEAVTVVYGDTELRARLASVALLAMGIEAPVYRGCEHMWAGHEGRHVDGLADANYASGDAVDVLIERAAINPGSLDIVAIGPLTNIATAVLRDPGFASNVRHLTLMGGEFTRGWPEHNFSSDAAATEIVLRSGMSMTIMPLNQTLRVMIDQADTQRIAEAHPLGALMADQAQRFWTWLATRTPFARGTSSAAHDPAALLMLFEPSLFTFTPMTIDALESGDFDGRIRGIADESSLINVVTDMDALSVHDAFLRVLGCA
ncbi:MAG: nucleoside hydrolase [Actinobacteria bacterium]|nr:nucleoside hydrolase [Actinomycetota bacterium]